MELHWKGMKSPKRRQFKHNLIYFVIWLYSMYVIDLNLASSCNILHISKMVSSWHLVENNSVKKNKAKQSVIHHWPCSFTITLTEFLKLQISPWRFFWRFWCGVSTCCYSAFRRFIGGLRPWAIKDSVETNSHITYKAAFRTAIVLSETCMKK